MCLRLLHKKRIIKNYFVCFIDAFMWKHWLVINKKWLHESKYWYRNQIDRMEWFEPTINARICLFRSLYSDNSGLHFRIHESVILEMYWKVVFYWPLQTIWETALVSRLFKGTLIFFLFLF